MPKPDPLDEQLADFLSGLDLDTHPSEVAWGLIRDVIAESLVRHGAMAVIGRCDDTGQWYALTISGGLLLDCTFAEGVSILKLLAEPRHPDVVGALIFRSSQLLLVYRDGSVEPQLRLA